MTDSPEHADKRDLVSGSLVRNLMRLSLPIAAQTVLFALYNLIDAYWLGKWSTEGLAAPGATGPFVWLVVSIGMGFGSAGTAMVAQFTGAKRHEEASHAAGQVILLMTVCAAVLALPMVALAPQVLWLFRVPPELIPKASTYLRIVMAGLPLVGFSMAYGAVLRALGNTMTVLLIGAAANLINVIIDPIFIFGWGYFPRMGVAGAATATVVAHIFSAYVSFVLLKRHHAGLQVTRAHLKANWPILKRMMSVGTPAAINNSSGSLGFLMFQMMINSLGVTVLAAFTIGFRLLNFIQVPGQALGAAAAPIVGQALGAGKPEFARKAIWVSVLIVATTTIVPIALLMVEGPLVAGFFIKDPEVIVEATRFLRIVPASSYLFGIIMVLMAAFFGSGHTRPAMLLTILRMWLIRVPVGYVLAFVLGLGAAGAYWGMVAGNVISGVLALELFRRGSWERVIIPAARTRAVAAVPETAADTQEPTLGEESAAGD